MGAAAQRITTILGDAVDGKPARETPLWRPSAVAAGPDGAVYFADDGSGTVRRIEKNGVARVVASSLRGPWALAFAPGGALHAIDARRNRILRIHAGGATEAVAGSGGFGYLGDGGPAAHARLSLPQGIAFDRAGHLYVADSDNHAVRRVDAQTGVITTIAAGLQYPWGIAVDATGNIFVADTYAHVVRRIEAGGGAMRIVAGNGRRETAGDGGPATEASLDSPTGLAVAPNGDLYIGQFRRIRKVSAADERMTAVAGGGPVPLGESHRRPAAEVYLPGRCGQLALAPDGGLLVALPDDNTVARVHPGNGLFEILAGNPLWVGDGSRGVINVVSQPRKLALDASGGVLYVADSGNHRILRVPLADINRAAPVAGAGGAGMRIADPQGVAVDAAGSVYLTDEGRRVWKVPRGGVPQLLAGGSGNGYAGDGGPAVAALLNGAAAVAVDRAGQVYIADSGNRRVRVIERGGRLRTLAGDGEYGDSGDGGPAAAARLSWVADLLLDGRGGLLLADLNNDRIRRVDLKTGIITTVAKLPAPRALARDAGGTLLAANEQRIYRINASGEAVTVAEGLPGVPDGMVVDARGRMIFSDSQNNRIRALGPTQPSRERKRAVP